MTDNTLPPSRDWDYNDRNGELSFETEGGYTARLVPDFDPVHPRLDWEPLGTLFLSDNRYLSGDKGAADPNDLDPSEIAVLLPVYILAHGVVRVSVGSFNDPWDSWEGGAIYLTREAVREEYGWKILTKKRKAKLESYLRNEIVTLNDYLSGDVMGLIVTDPDGEELENCWGFYPTHDSSNGHYMFNSGPDRWAYVISEAQAAIDADVRAKTINPAFAGVGL